MKLLKNKTVILFDIDYTLFDTDRYRELLYSELGKELGYKSFSEFYPITKIVSAEVRLKYGYYNPSLVLNGLLQHKKRETNFETIEKIFWGENIYEKSLYTQTKAILETLTTFENLTIGILSTGLDKHQLAKIRSIDKYLHKEHIHIFVDKVQQLPNILEKYSDSRIILIDDLPKVLVAAKNLNKDVNTILIKREKKYEETIEISDYKPDFLIKDQSEILRILTDLL